MIAWVYLVVAGLLEIGWPVGLKLAQQPAHRWIGVAMAVAFMAASGTFLWMAQRTIPIGTAYAVWTGIGAAGTFAVGVTFFGDTLAAGRLLGIGLIIDGVAALKLSH
jgi:quaternary ammonium compound-resistance protein SugE